MKFLPLILALSIFIHAYEINDTLNPQTISTLELKENKLYIVDFFASWCGSCKKELPLISKVNSHIDASKVQIIGIDIDTDIKQGKEFQKSLKEKNQLNFRVINDPDKLIVKEFKPMGIPALYYIRNGKVLDVIFGAVDDIDKKILKDIEKL